LISEISFKSTVAGVLEFGNGLEVVFVPLLGDLDNFVDHVNFELFKFSSEKF
jgi:hypothetical protein